MSSRGLNISALARRTGVAPDTLRKWEQRYEILRPSRTPGGQRRYDERDVARVEWLCARLAEGYRIGEAAQLLGNGAEIAPASPAELRSELLAAVERADTPAIERLLEQAFALDRMERTLEDVIAPTLARVGERWADGSLSVAHEHLLTAAIRAHLARLLADTRGTVRGVAVLTCAPGERHELGLLMLAVLLRADGWHVAYLGADMPLSDAVRFASDVRAKLLCVSASLTDRFADVAQELEAEPVPDGMTLVLGGRAVTPERAQAVGAQYANGALERTVKSLRSIA